jgi:multidrug efflux system membrane fusion protein
MKILKQFNSTLEQKPYILALAITASLIAWMATGDEKVLHSEKAEQEQHLAKVEVTTYVPQQISRAIQLYGRTEPERTLALSSELEGKVAEILVDEGQYVEKGQVVVKLAVEDKLAQLEYAKALVKQREVEYQGAMSLVKQGLHDESKLAQAKAAYESAKATQVQRQVMLDKCLVKAPFSGYLDARQIEVGNFVRKGDELFKLVDLDPLLVHANVTEKHIDALTEDNLVKVSLIDGTEVMGKVRYIASLSNSGTNTFPIEVAIPNPNQNMKAGVSTELDIQFNPEPAIKVTPALLSLDKSGNLGVKTVVQDMVKFVPIDMLKAEKDGVWLAGFDGETDVITLGQGFVRPGDKVIVSHKQL